MQWYDGHVTQEDISEAFPAQMVEHHRWNGSVIPRFTRKTVSRVIDVLNAQDFALDPDGGFRLTWEGDAIRFYELNEARHSLDYRGELIRPDSEGYYTIGAEWCTWIDVRTINA
jgi:hypothetical protein